MMFSIYCNWKQL